MLAAQNDLSAPFSRVSTIVIIKLLAVLKRLDPLQSVFQLQILNYGLLTIATNFLKFLLDDHFDISSLVAIGLLFVYLLFGTLVFFLSEEWSLVECFYFVYISLTTIGFGDYVPQHPLALLTTVVYIIFGLALTGLALNTIQVIVNLNSGVSFIYEISIENHILFFKD